MPARDSPLPARRGVVPRYLGAALAVRMADEGVRVSLVLLALRETGSPAVGGALVAALLVPHVLAAPLVGTVLDRARHPQRVLAAAVLLFAASLLSAAMLLGRAPLWVTVAVLLAGGCGGPALTGGLSGQLPRLVGRDRAPRAFGLDSLFYNVASMAGPAVTAAAAVAAGPRVAQALLASMAVLGAAGAASLPLTVGGGRRPVRGPGLLNGGKAILTQPTLRIVTLSSSLGQLGPGALTVVAAVIATAAHRPESSGLLLSAVAAGALFGSLLWTWRPLAPNRSALVTTMAMIAIGIPLLLAATTSSLKILALLFGISGVFVGPFGSALFTARTLYADGNVRGQVFTIGAGLKVSAGALGAGLIGLAADLPIATQLVLVASSPLLAGVLGTAMLVANTRGMSSPVVGSHPRTQR